MSLQQAIEVAFRRWVLCDPVEATRDTRAMRFSHCPQLAFRHHCDRSQNDRVPIAPLEAKDFAGVALAERDLPALSNDLEFPGFFPRDQPIHAIMLSCKA